MYSKPGHYRITAGEWKGYIGSLGVCTCDRCPQLLAEGKARVIILPHVQAEVDQSEIEFLYEREEGEEKLTELIRQFAFEDGIPLSELPDFAEDVVRTFIFRRLMMDDLQHKAREAGAEVRVVKISPADDSGVEFN